jgi:hypothetical protein
MNEQRVEIFFANALQIQSAPVGSQRITIRYESFTITVQGVRIMYTLPVDHQVQMQVSYVDSSGNPASIDGLVQWTTSDAALASVTVDPDDSTIVTVVPVGPTGQVQVTATADADLGAGVKSLLTVSDITLAAGEAVAGTIAPVGEATPKP